MTKRLFWGDFFHKHILRIFYYGHKWDQVGAPEGDLCHLTRWWSQTQSSEIHSWNVFSLDGPQKFHTPACRGRERLEERSRKIMDKITEAQKSHPLLCSYIFLSSFMAYTLMIPKALSPTQISMSLGLFNSILLWYINICHFHLMTHLLRHLKQFIESTTP